MPYPKIRDPEITIPIHCKRHREYGGKKAPTSGCPVCEMFYLERRKALADVKAALRLLDRYGAIEVERDPATIEPDEWIDIPQHVPGQMRIITPPWMSHGRVVVSNSGPRRRQNDGALLYERLRR